MTPHRLYILQAYYDGMTYSKDNLIDTYAAFNVLCSEIPFKIYPDAKDVVAKNWRGLHGADAYIPAVNKIKDYDIEVDFLYSGTHANMRNDLDSFAKYINGMLGNSPQPALSARLAIYDEYTQTGRKDVRAVNIEFKEYWDTPDFDTECIAAFKVKFHVYDPVTEVTPVYNQQGNLTDLTWT